jgi:hypothetical protein
VSTVPSYPEQSRLARGSVHLHVERYEDRVQHGGNHDHHEGQNRITRDLSSTATVNCHHFHYLPYFECCARKSSVVANISFAWGSAKSNWYS